MRNFYRKITKFVCNLFYKSLAIPKWYYRKWGIYAERIKNSKKTLILFSLIIMLSSILIVEQTQANSFNNEVVGNDLVIENMSINNNSTRALQPNNSEIGGRTYYIKNMVTGQYLDVED